MKWFISALILLSAVANSFGQTSKVVLSSLNVTTMIDASVQENSGFFIVFTVNHPKLLNRLEISVEDGVNPDNTTTTIIPILITENKVEMVFKKYNVPFENNTAKFLLTVKDKLTSPFHKIVIRGYDQAGHHTNHLVYDQLK